MKHEQIISDLGGASEVARLCEVTPQAVSQWTGIDPETGEEREIPKARLMYLKAIRPDVFVQPATPTPAPELPIAMVRREDDRRAPENQRAVDRRQIRQHDRSERRDAPGSR